ncbi:MAG: hypothetical protein AB7G87_03815 [Clostridia bacterium]
MFKEDNDTMSIFEVFGNKIPDNFKKVLEVKKEEKKVVAKKKQTTVGGKSNSSSTPTKSKEETTFIKLPTKVCYARLTMELTENEFEPALLSEAKRQYREQQKKDAKNDKKKDSNETEDTTDDSIQMLDMDELQSDTDETRVSLEHIRQLLERDFPELSKERTKMDYRESDNLIVPIVYSGAKGAPLSPPPNTMAKGFYWRLKDIVDNKKPINIVASRDGQLYEVREEPGLGIFVAKVNNISELDLLHEGFWSYINRIPFSILQQIITFFRDVAAKNDKYEAMVQIFFDIEKKEYFVVVPEQQVTPISVNYFCKTNIPHAELIITIHSHPSFVARFSYIDDADEVRTGLYGVIGYVDKYVPDILIRMSCGGKYVELPTEQIFEFPKDLDVIENITYPPEWHKSICFIESNLRGDMKYEQFDKDKL